MSLPTFYLLSLDDDIDIVTGWHIGDNIQIVTDGEKVVLRKVEMPEV